MSPDRACRGAPEGTRFACVPKQPGPRKAAMGIGLITVCDAAFRAAPLAPACPRAVPHTRVGTKAGGCYGAVAWRFSRIPTAPSRLSATALASPECQPALNIDPRSASKIDPPAWWLVPVVHRGDPRDAECPSRG